MSCDASSGDGCESVRSSVCVLFISMEMLQAGESSGSIEHGMCAGGSHGSPSVEWKASSMANRRERSTSRRWVRKKRKSISSWSVSLSTWSRISSFGTAYACRCQTACG